jgi:nitrile hydratase accessory protein
VRPGDALEAGFAEPSLPRSNGSPTFDAPWQARALAMAVLVVARAGCPWNEFRRRLIAAIDEEPSRPYWDSWVAALDRFVAETDVASGTG